MAEKRDNSGTLSKNHNPKTDKSPPDVGEALVNGRGILAFRMGEGRISRQILLVVVSEERAKTRRRHVRGRFCTRGSETSKVYRFRDYHDARLEQKWCDALEKRRRKLLRNWGLRERLALYARRFLLRLKPMPPCEPVTISYELLFGAAK
jgi:hypothetical protein